LVWRQASDQATVLDGDPALPKKGAQQSSTHFSAHVYYGQTDGWIKMPLGTEVGLGPGQNVLDGNPNDLDGNPTPPQKGHSTPTNFRSMSTVAISATAELLLHSSRQRVAILYNGRPLSPLKLPLHTRDMDFNKYVVPLAHQSSQSKQHLDRFSCSCSSHYSDRQN